MNLLEDSSAQISNCGRYRYRLQRSWNRALPSPLFIMLNPSTADAEIDDATIRSIKRLCYAWDFGGFEVVNLYAWRATDPRELERAADPVGPENDSVIADALSRCEPVVCAWGAHKMAESRALAVLAAAKVSNVTPYCLGKTKAGHPCHPLYLKTGTPLEPLDSMGCDESPNKRAWAELGL